MIILISCDTDILIVIEKAKRDRMIERNNKLVAEKAKILKEKKLEKDKRCQEAVERWKAEKNKVFLKNVGRDREF